MENPLPKRRGMGMVLPHLMAMYGAMDSMPRERKVIAPFKRENPVVSMPIPNSPARKAKKKANRQKRHKNRKRRGY